MGQHKILASQQKKLAVFFSVSFLLKDGYSRGGAFVRKFYNNPAFHTKYLVVILKKWGTVIFAVNPPPSEKWRSVKDLGGGGDLRRFMSKSDFWHQSQTKLMKSAFEVSLPWGGIYGVQNYDIKFSLNNWGGVFTANTTVFKTRFIKRSCTN